MGLHTVTRTCYALILNLYKLTESSIILHWEYEFICIFMLYPVNKTTYNNLLIKHQITYKILHGGNVFPFLFFILILFCGLLTTTRETLLNTNPNQILDKFLAESFDTFVVGSLQLWAKTFNQSFKNTVLFMEKQ